MSAAHDRPHRPGQEGAVRRRHPQPQDLALDRADRGQHVLGHTGQPAAEAARGQHRLLRRDPAAVGQLRARGPVPGRQETDGLRAVEDHPGPLTGRQQGARQPARVGLVVAVHPQPAAHARREHRLQTAAFAPRQPLRVQAAALLEGVQLPQVLPVVGVEGHGERPAGAVAGVHAAGLLQLGREGRIAPGGGQIEGEQRLLAVVQLRHRGQHPGRDLRRAAARRRVGDGRAQPALGRAPGRDQADDTTADDEDVAEVRVLVLRVHGHPAPPFARHDPDQVRTVGGRPASLSARCVRAPASALRKATLVRPAEGPEGRPAPVGARPAFKHRDAVSEVSSQNALAHAGHRPTVDRVSEQTNTSSDRRVVIVGAGMAGVQTAVALREQGWDGEIRLLGAEPHRPYDRPPLSKAVLLGKAEGSAFEVDFDSLVIALELDREATGLRAAEHILDTDTGPVPYDVLVIATGADPVALPGSEGMPGVHVLRTMDDAERLRPVLAEPARRRRRRCGLDRRRVRHRRA
ncbi:hypothetical protein GCM10020000_59470 [Streptomyces olivoverticillatus]